MHEYGLARALFRQVEEIRQREAASRVVSVNVTVGEFAGVESELLQLAFDQIAADTAAGAARLVVETVALAASCDRCREEFTVERFHFVCPRCNSGEVTVVRGEELTLQRLELETEEL